MQLMYFCLLIKHQLETIQEYHILPNKGALHNRITGESKDLECHINIVIGRTDRNK